MAIHKRLVIQCQKPKKLKIMRRHFRVYILLAAILLISVPLVFSTGIFPSAVVEGEPAEPQSATPSLTSEQPNQLVKVTPQFDVHVTYAYVGPRKDHFTCQSPLQGKTQITTLNAVCLYPSIVYFNFTHVSSAEIESCDAKMEVYLIQLIADTGTTENYTYAEATNYNLAFSDLNALSSHINDFAEARSTSGLRGVFIFNWTTNTSSLEGRIGSYGSYTSNPSGLGLWSAGEPNTITVSVRRIGWITMNGKSVSTTLDTGSENIVQVQLKKFGDGFLYNTIVPQHKLPKINLYHPPIPDR